jgi:hypothetical protein
MRQCATVCRLLIQGERCAACGTRDSLASIGAGYAGCSGLLVVRGCALGSGVVVWAQREPAGGVYVGLKSHLRLLQLIFCCTCCVWVASCITRTRPALCAKVAGSVLLAGHCAFCSKRSL